MELVRDDSFDARVKSTGARQIYVKSIGTTPTVRELGTPVTHMRRRAARDRYCQTLSAATTAVFALSQRTENTIWKIIWTIWTNLNRSVGVAVRKFSFGAFGPLIILRIRSIWAIPPIRPGRTHGRLTS
ncbi:hypothetical protein EVAR_31114_1 [Eumeta japonica]|uniref:Uncharacterized protein n=1 Tax=Eumeta variegata TaxID=151549 RepID=A0A4C1VEZ1_EUMVA|nr:hypothetical protein EVAR_31114_1 [Eumeta japonica]